MKFLNPFLVFLLLNFGALGLGSWLMGDGAKTEWYLALNKAPWTPPGWVFGAAWTTIMICFSVYMTCLYLNNFNEKAIYLFSIQLLLSILWNFIFFNQHLVSLGLLIISGLTVVIILFLISYVNQLKAKTLLILPYFIWICVATSLNAYILLYN